ncbi:hypothetical protein H4Q26_014701 [Puccinia striiformis f. sp. tritici PST-130]|nr:hypothetical protein H4Q26_014701 [Puccinia striiformis f. sp. tritici PST-130]
MRAMDHPSHQLQHARSGRHPLPPSPPAFRSARAQLASTAERKTGRKVNLARPPSQAQRALDASGQPSRLSYQFFGHVFPTPECETLELSATFLFNNKIPT